MYIRGIGQTKPLGLNAIISLFKFWFVFELFEIDGIKNIEIKNVNIKINNIEKNKLFEIKIASNKKMAGVEGFEPSQAVLETDVLPLTLYPYNYFSVFFSKTFIILAHFLIFDK